MQIIYKIVVFICFITVTLHAETKEKFSVDKNLFPYKSHYLTLENGAKIHYVDEGKGPLLLLLHGNPTWSFLYRDIIKALKSDFRLIAPDYPGFGLSTAPKDYDFSAASHAKSMQEFVKKLDLKEITMMVQDWGGPIGFSLALNSPDRFKGFVIANTWAWPLERLGQKGFSLLMGGYFGEFISWGCNGIVRFFMFKGVSKTLSEDILAMYHAPFENREDRQQTHIFPAQLRGAKPFLQEIYKGLPTLADKPALIVWGEEDFAFQTPERQRFETLFTNHKTILLKEAGHFVQEDAPQEIADAIRAWY
ncbi:MAG: alpha/beta fold hydrolase [Epsilonproteobacteria bacterium]|nr:alpha/beta fold hydrolase [Campylobacterota bacterium]